MNIQTLLDRPIAFHRCFVTITGSVNAAVMLSQAFYWSGRATLDDNWFFKTQSEWENETGLTRREQETARNILKSKGFLIENLKGAPAKMHYRLNMEAIQTSLAENAILDCTKEPNLNGGNSQTTNGTETTSETTSDIKNECKPIKQSKFVQPTLEEVKLQAEKIGLNLFEAEQFFDYYGSVGWKVGGRSLMVDWHKALSGWKSRHENGQFSTPRFSGFFNDKPRIIIDHSKGF